MAYCEKCGAKIEDGEQLCPSCGAPVQAEQQEQQAEGASGNNDISSKLASLNDTADMTDEFDKDDIENNKIMAVLAYILFLIPLLAAKESPFAKFHTNQGLVLFIAGLISSAIFIIPIIGWIITPILSIVVMVLAVIGIINALNGKAKELPVIGKLKILK